MLQRDTLTPYLFVIVIDDILRKSLTLEDADTVRRHVLAQRLAVKIHALAYADDAVLISDDPDEAHRQLHRF